MFQAFVDVTDKAAVTEEHITQLANNDWKSFIMVDGGQLASLADLSVQYIMRALYELPG
jgi:hypothetical protein